MNVVEMSAAASYRREPAADNANQRVFVVHVLAPEQPGALSSLQLCIISNQLELSKFVC